MCTELGEALERAFPGRLFRLSVTITRLPQKRRIIAPSDNQCGERDRPQNSAVFSCDLCSPSQRDRFAAAELVGHQISSSLACLGFRCCQVSEFRAFEVGDDFGPCSNVNEVAHGQLSRPCCRLQRAYLVRNRTKETLRG